MGAFRHNNVFTIKPLTVCLRVMAVSACAHEEYPPVSTDIIYPVDTGSISSRSRARLDQWKRQLGMYVPIVSSFVNH